MGEKLSVRTWAAVTALHMINRALKHFPASLAELGYTEGEITEMGARSHLIAGVNFALNREWDAEQTAAYLEEMAGQLRSGEAFEAAEKIKREWPWGR